MLAQAVNRLTVDRKRSLTIKPLMTPIDETEVTGKTKNQKDSEMRRKKQVARREKLSADLCLLAGSPLDAYQRYLKSIELCKACLDPIWLAGSLEGCAASLNTMADMGGAGVDEFLNATFGGDLNPYCSSSLTNAELKSLLLVPSAEELQPRQDSPPVKTLPQTIFSLTVEALSIFSRNIKVSSLYSELAIKLARYCATLEDSHLFGRWGEGENCYSGDTVTGFRRLERSQTVMSSASSVTSFDSKDSESGTASGKEPPLPPIVVSRCARISEWLHRATGADGLSPESRARICASAAKICLVGVRFSLLKKNGTELSYHKTLLRRKAAFFTAIAADSLSLHVDDEVNGPRASQLWFAASKLYGSPRETEGAYGWVTLRGAVLHGLSQLRNNKYRESALVSLLSLLTELSPSKDGGLGSQLGGVDLGGKNFSSTYFTNEQSEPDSSAAPASSPPKSERRFSYRSGVGGELEDTGYDSMEVDDEEEGEDDDDPSEDDQPTSVPPAEVRRRTSHEGSADSSSTPNPSSASRPKSTGAKALRMMKRSTANAFSTLTTSTANAAKNVATAASGGTSIISGSGVTGAEPISSITHFHRKRDSFSSHANNGALAKIINSRANRTKSVGEAIGVSKPNSVHRQSSLGSAQELMRAEAAAATARAIVGVEEHAPNVLPPLMCLPAVVGQLDSDMAVIVQRDVIHEIMKLRASKGEREGVKSGERAYDFIPVSLNSIKMHTANNKIVEEKKKIATKSIDAIADNMQTFYNPYAESRDKKVKKATLICQGEAHRLVVGFRNALSIPLEVMGCTLLFGVGLSEGLSKSFVIPPLAENFEVEFSFVKEQVGEVGVVGVELTTLLTTQKLYLAHRAEDMLRFRTLQDRKGEEGKEGGEEGGGGVLIKAIQPQPTIVPVGGGVVDGDVITVDICEGEVKRLPALTLSRGGAKAESVEEIKMSFDGRVAFGKKLGEGEGNYGEGDISGEINIKKGEDGLKFGYSAKIGEEEDEVGVVNLSLSDVKAGFEKTLLFKYRGKAVIEGEHEIMYWRTMSIKVVARKISGPRIVSVVVRPDLHPLLDDDKPSVAFDNLKEQVLSSQKGRGIVVGRSGRLGSMIGGRTLSSDPAYLAHMAGEDLSDSDDDQSVGGRSFVSRCFGGGGEGEGEEGGPVSFGWGAGGGEDGGALDFDTCSKFFTVVCEVENVCCRDIVVWGEGEGEGGEVVTAGGMSRILVNLDRIVGMEDFVTLQGHLEKVQVLKWKEVEDGGDGGDGGRVGVLRVDDEAIHDLFDDDEDVLRRISGLGFEVDVQANGFFKEREWGSAKATIRIDKAAQANLKNQKIGSVICEWLCDGEGEGEGMRGREGVFAAGTGGS
ncbi:hypothetical protein TL16_g12939 [Triparma laevis f. inornata]|uniref:Trs120/TRAPPC9 N-terminal domain-containing protein n=1 Tax=Triparma laevis f. inornata TaxID=1714386 RepID=A0A9W7BNK9_9STRA|nr:hypothetical protein TL16_g12939 [Triparma laevis f. inornata]